MVYGFLQSMSLKISISSFILHLLAIGGPIIFDFALESQLPFDIKFFKNSVMSIQLMRFIESMVILFCHLCS